MSFQFLSLKKSKKPSFSRPKFFTPELLSLESRLNPVAFTGTVNLANSIVQLLMTSTGVGGNANNITVTNTSATTIQIDAGAGNTITLTDGTGGNLNISGATAQTATIDLNAVSIAGLTLTGNSGTDLFTIGAFDATAMQTTTNFNVFIDSSSNPGGVDTFSVNGALVLKGDGSLNTSDNANTSINLAQATVATTGSITASGNGSVLLIANSAVLSNVTIANGGLITTAAGSVTLGATLTPNPTGQILLNGNAITTNGGPITFLSNVVLQSATTINSGSSTTGNVSFNANINGANNLTVNSLGVVTVTGSIGNTTPLGTINFSGGSTSLTVAGNISAASLSTTAPINGNITISGNQNYSNIAGLNLNAANNGNINLGGNITMVANAPLQLSHAGRLSIGGNITNGLLNEIGTSATSTTTLGTVGAITISVNAGITFNSPVTLGQNTTLITGLSQGITFNNTIDGSRTLSLNTVGAVLFNDNVGSVSAVSQILSITNNPSSITFSDTLTPGKSLRVGVLNAITTGDIILTVDQIYSGGGLTLQTLGTTGAGNITLGSVVSNLGSVGSVSINNAGVLNITKNITLDGIFSQTSAGVISVGTTPGSKITLTTNNQDILLTGPATLNQDFDIIAGTANTSDLTLGVINSLGGNAFDLTIIAGGNLTLNGSLGNLTQLGAINTAFATLASINTGVNALVINAESFNSKVNGSAFITASQTYNTAAGFKFIGLSSSNTTKFASITTTNGGVVSITNAGPLQLTGNIAADGTVTQTGGGSVSFGTVTNPVTPFSISTTNDPISFNDAINLIANTTINSLGGNITFNNLVDGDFNFTINASGGAVLLGGRLGFNAINVVSINDASSTTLLGSIFADSLAINNATGPVVITGSMQLNNTTGNSLTINTSTQQATVVLQGAINAPRDVVINNTGALTLADTADIIITSGAFTQSGTGAVYLAGDISTTGDITFNGSVNLSGSSLLSALNSLTPATISFAGTLEGLGNVALASSGTIIFNANVGSNNRVGILEIRNAINIAPLGVAVNFKGTLNTSTLSFLNVNGGVVIQGSAIIQSALNTSASNFNLTFSGNSTAIGGQANFLNSGIVSLRNNTTFTGASSFSTAGSLDVQGIITASGSFSAQRPVNISAPVTLNLTTSTNGITSAITGVNIITLGGSGNLTLSGNSPAYSGSFQLNTGSLQVSALFSNATVNLAGGTLKGTGQVLQVIGTTGTLFPGSALGTLTLASQLNLSSANTFSTQINGATVGSFGQVAVTGGITNLGSSTLSITSATNLSVGQQIVIINNGTTTSISGQFKNLLEGAAITVGNTSFTISYKGGTGNDVVLTVASINPIAPPPGTFIPSQVIGVDFGGGSVVQIQYTNGQNLSFFAYSSAYTGGVRVALGDVNGDGVNDLITGTGIGGGPHIKVFDLRGGQPVEIASFFAFEPNFMGGVFVASGDINADGFDDIIIAAGAGGGPRVKVIAGRSNYALNPVVPLMDFFAYDPAFTGGATVAAGNRDGIAGDEVITGAGFGGGPNVRSFNGAGQIVDNFFAFNSNITTGIFIAAGYIDGDGIADIIAGTGFGVPSQVNAFYSNGTTASALPFTGVFIGGARVGIAMNSSNQQVFAVAAGPGGAPVVNLLNSSLATTSSYIAIDALFSGGLFLNTSL